MHIRLPKAARLLGSFILLVSAPLSAQTLRVAPSTSYPTIQSAIAASINGDIVEVPPGTYAESLDLLGRQITLRSQAGPATTIMSSPDRIIRAASQESRDTRIEGFTFRGVHLDTSATIEVTNSGLTIENCVFDAIAGITAAYVYYNFLQDSSTVRGYNANLGIFSSRFENCRARDGETGPYGYDYPVRGANGGAISFNGGTLEIDDCHFLNNRAGSAGAFLDVNLNGPPREGGSGGAIWLTQAQAYISRSSFESNRAGTGSIDFSGLGNLGGGGNGGAIAGSAYLQVTDCRFITNESGRSPIWPFALDGKGGAIRTESYSALISSSAFVGNAAREGGAIEKFGTYFTPTLRFRIENSIFAGNVAASVGGALRFVNPIAGDIVHCDFVGNTAGDGAAIYAPTALGVIDVANSIFSGSQGPDIGPSATMNATSIVATSNLLAQTSVPGTGNFTGDPGLVDTANLDFHLRPDSICLDAGASLARPAMKDFDGEARPFGTAVDVGADEFRGLAPSAAGTVPDGQGGLADVLRVNGSAGGNTRYILLPLGSAPAWRIDPEPTSTDPDHFILWGRVGIPTFDETFAIAFLGAELCFVPQPVDWFNPAKFLFANSFDPTAPALTPSVPAPFAVQAPAFNFPITITVQGLILGDSLQFHVTNAIAVEIH